MSIIPVYLAPPNGYLIFKIDEEKLRAHSRTADRALQMLQVDQGLGIGAPGRAVYFSGSAPALVYVLQRIQDKKPDRDLHIKVHDMPLKHVICIYQAVELLGVEPVQPQIEGHIIGYISHHLLEPEEMLAAATAFHSLQETSKVWRVLVQQIAWNIANDKYGEEKAQMLQDAATANHPELLAAVTERINVLLVRKLEHEERTARQSARD